MMKLLLGLKGGLAATEINYRLCRESGSQARDRRSGAGIEAMEGSFQGEQGLGSKGGCRYGN